MNERMRCIAWIKLKLHVIFQNIYWTRIDIVLKSIDHEHFTKWKKWIQDRRKMCLVNYALWKSSFAMTFWKFNLLWDMDKRDHKFCESPIIHEIDAVASGYSHEWLFFTHFIFDDFIMNHIGHLANTFVHAKTMHVLQNKCLHRFFFHFFFFQIFV